MANLLKGKPVADRITEELAVRCEALKAKGIIPTLAILKVGENDGSNSYEKGALSRCDKCGIQVVRVTLPETATQEEVLAEIEKINKDNAIHGCLMFRPLPKHLNEHEICQALTPAKDVDSMTDLSLATTFIGKGSGFAPCTAQSVLEILTHYGVDPAGKNVAVVGRSLVIGKPVSMMLLNRNATVTICHRKTANAAELCSRADILIAAAGSAGLVKAGYTNPNQVVIDVGVNAAPGGGICGDVAFDEVEPCVAAISPVPGGVGSVTTAVLCKHLIEAAEKTVA